jgi:hypothetical protein
MSAERNTLVNHHTYELDTKVHHFRDHLPLLLWNGTIGKKHIGCEARPTGNLWSCAC